MIQMLKDRDVNNDFVQKYTSPDLHPQFTFRYFYFSTNSDLPISYTENHINEKVDRGNDV